MPILIEDHDEAKDLFERFERSDAAPKEKVIAQALIELKIPCRHRRRNLGVQQIATIMNVYGNALMESKRTAKSKMVQMALRPALREAK